jgi:hypothetical protein
MFLAKIFVVAAAIATAPLIAPPSAAGTGAQSASGSGQFEFTSDAGVTGLRTFAFEASKSSDGSVIGEAEVKNRAIGVTFHIRIDCLNLISNVAVASGTVTAASGPGTAVGDAEIFGVQDNGEGTNAPPDLITPAFGNTGIVCTDITAQALPGLSGLFNPVQEGNIQVHSM